MIFLPVLNKDVKEGARFLSVLEMRNCRFPGPLPHPTLEVRDAPSQNRISCIQRTTVSRQHFPLLCKVQINKPFFLDLHWHFFFSCESRISKSTRRHCFPSCIQLPLPLSRGFSSVLQTYFEGLLCEGLCTGC